MTHLAGSCGAQTCDHGHVGHLHRQVATVDEGPSPPRPACLELATERAQVRVPEQAAVGISPGQAGRPPTLIVTRLGFEGTCGVGGAESGPVAGAVPLGEELTDAEDGRVEDEIAAATACGAAGTAGVGAQCRAGVPRLQRLPLVAAEVRRGGHVLRIAVVDLALLAAHCGRTWNNFTHRQHHRATHGRTVCSR